MLSEQIWILCTAPEHLVAPDRFGTVTLVRSSEPAWAFCPSVATDGHQWARGANPHSLPAARLASRRRATITSPAL